MTVYQLTDSPFTLSVDEAVERHQELYARFWDIIMDESHSLNPVNLELGGINVQIKGGKESLSWRFQTEVLEPLGSSFGVPQALSSELAKKRRIVEVVTRLKSEEDPEGVVYVSAGCWELSDLNQGDLTLQTNTGRRYYKWIFDSDDTHHAKQDDLMAFILHFLGKGQPPIPKQDHKLVIDTSEGIL